MSYFDISNWFVEVFDLVIPLLLSKSVMFLGQAGFGKTPVMNILAMAMSRYHIRHSDLAVHEGSANILPCFRSAPNLDFFRGERGAMSSVHLYVFGLSSCRFSSPLSPFSRVHPVPNCISKPAPTIQNVSRGFSARISNIFACLKHSREISSADW